jgi:hypothetical protein
MSDKNFRRIMAGLKDAQALAEGRPDPRGYLVHVPKEQTSPEADAVRGAQAAVARLRRALQLKGQESDDAEVIEEIIAAFVARLPAGTAVMLERSFQCLAVAAEELGPQATPRQIVDRGIELEDRPS